MAIPDLEAIKPDNFDLDFLFFLPLAKLNAAGQLEGHLAHSWRHSADHREYTFYLRQLRWTDGTPVTAHDVKFTLDLLSHRDVGEYTGIEATVVNDSTVRIRAPNPSYIDDISYFPRHRLARLEPKDFWSWEFWTQPVANGPYRFVRYVPNSMMEVEANPDHFAGKPKIERLVLKFVGDAGFTELLAGNVDIAVGHLAQIPRILNDPRFRVYSRGRPGARAIYWKVDHALFADAQVRRALTLAIDRSELLRLLNLPQELPITDGVFTTRQFHRRDWPEPLPYDAQQARALLDASGWLDRDHDGVREKGRLRFQFTATVMQGHGFPQLAVYVQQFLRAVGVRMDIQYNDEATMWRRLRSGDFEAWLGVAQAGVSAQLRDFGRGNATGYNNAQAFAAIDTLITVADPAEQDRLYRRLTTIYRADLPFTRLIPWSREWFVHARVRGLSTPFRSDPDTHMERLWVESAQPRR